MPRYLVIPSALLVVAAACGGGGGDGPTPPGNNQVLGSIQATPATLNIAAGSFQTISVQARDEQNNVITGVTGFQFTSQNPAVAEVAGDGEVLGVSAGTTTISISLTRAGITKSTSVQVTVGGALPTTANVQATNALVFSPARVVVARNGAVSWTFGTTKHDVTFGSGNAPQNIGESVSTTVTRNFTTAGNFSYSCTLHAGMSGQVIVR